MRVVIQRVRSASVESEGTLAGSIGMGLLLYIGVADGDTEADMKYVADKIPNLRIFPDENDKMNLSLLDVKGEILAVSQFTLMGDCSHGRRPGFSDAMAPDAARRDPCGNRRIPNLDAGFFCKLGTCNLYFGKQKIGGSNGNLSH